MIEPAERQTSLRPAYVVWTVILIVVLSVLQLLVVFGALCISYGLPTFQEILTIRDPDFSNAVLWKGRISYPLFKLSPNFPSPVMAISSFDPEKGGLSEFELKTQSRSRCSGLLVQGDRLWALFLNSVVAIDGEQSTEFIPKRGLVRPCEPFLYENQLAVIDMGTVPAPTLLVFRDHEWEELGSVVVPIAVKQTTVNGKLVLERQAANANVKSRTGQLDLQVITFNDKQHLFAFDGQIVVYHFGIELAPVSALAPANGVEFTDLSNLAEWEVVCNSSSKIGIQRKAAWKASFVDGEPIVLNVAASSSNPFQGSSLRVYRRMESTWQKTTETPVSAPLQFLAASNGQQTYFAVFSVMQTLRINKLINDQIESTGVFIKAPNAGFQPAYERFVLLYTWIYWPSLIVVGMAVSRLMNAYRTSDYQFGMTTVQLASLTRRYLARIIDYVPYWACFYLLMLWYGFSSDQQKFQEDLDKIFDIGPNGILVRFGWMILSSLACSLVILGTNSWLQGRWGVTLGKWICGIRTVRSTLRPCGFARALLRELLLVADTFFFGTYILVTLLIAFTSCRQRIGDLVADTIVIRKPEPPDDFGQTNAT